MSEKNIIDEAINNLLQNRDLIGNSRTWANWMSKLTLSTCKYCTQQHGKIFDISILENKFEVNAHENCKCLYVSMRTKKAGTATDQGVNGADIYLMQYRKLPDYYVTREFAENAGWVNWKGNLHTILPNCMIGGNVYKNRDGKLPHANGRIWYEADINYNGGFRNRQRLLYSNEGLIFASYDHYQTFYEITKWGEYYVQI